MNLGLGNLTELKAWLLAPELRTDTGWDVQIAAIGRGVAIAFEQFCNRKLERLVGAQVDFTGDRMQYSLPRYPIEALTLVEVREGVSGAWTDITSTVEAQSSLSGLITFGAEPGSRQSRVRVTWTGGYWFDASEDASGVLPGGTTALPADLKLAWFQHCAAVWARYPKLGVPVNKIQAAAPAGVTFSSEVQDVLAVYRRVQLS